METWILIAWFVTSVGPTAVTHEFVTQAACEDAAEALGEGSQQWGSVCVPKGGGGAAAP